MRETFFPLAMSGYAKTQGLELEYNNWESDDGIFLFEILDFDRKPAARYYEWWELGFVVRGGDFDQLEAPGGDWERLKSFILGLKRSQMTERFYVIGIRDEKPRIHLDESFFYFLWKVRFYIRKKEG